MPAAALPSILDTSGFADPGDLRRQVLEGLRRAMGWELAFLTRVEDGVLEVLEVAGDHDWITPGDRLPAEATFCFRLMNGAPPWTDRLSDPSSPYHETACREAIGAESYSGHVVRRLDGAAFGTLCAIDRERREPTADQRALGDVFARLLAWEIDRDAMLQEIVLLARTDALTGLVNRSAFYERLSEEVSRSVRHGSPLTLVLFDIDHFKRVNDRHGHPAGDLALVHAADTIGALVRAGDVLARVGGEEFAWLLPATAGAAGRRAAERARTAIAATPFPHGAPVTISAGVCELASAASPEDLYRLADRALYRAKDEGRDTCVLHRREEPLSA